MTSEWVFGDEHGMPGAGWMSREEYLKRLESPTTIVPTVAPAPPVRYPWTEPEPHKVGLSWRVARSLDTLLGQVNVLAPLRSKASDGSVGDASHQTRDSDHNPWYGPGVVTARDYTHDPAGGLDCVSLANALVASRDPRIKYMIWNQRIIDSRPGNNPWAWVHYSGTNPHTKHLHLSVMPNASCDDTRAWSLGGAAPAVAPQGGPVSDVWARREKPWAGGISNIEPGGPVAPEEYDAFMYGLRNNVLGNQGNRMLEQLLGEVRALRTEVAKLRERLGDG